MSKHFYICILCIICWSVSPWSPWSMKMFSTGMVGCLFVKDAIFPTETDPEKSVFQPLLCPTITRIRLGTLSKNMEFHPVKLAISIISVNISEIPILVVGNWFPHDFQEFSYSTGVSKRNGTPTPQIPWVALMFHMKCVKHCPNSQSFDPGFDVAIGGQSLAWPPTAAGMTADV